MTFLSYFLVAFVVGGVFAQPPNWRPSRSCRGVSCTQAACVDAAPGECCEVCPNGNLFVVFQHFIWPTTVADANKRILLRIAFE